MAITLTKDELKTRIGSIVTRAKQYIDDNVNTARLNTVDSSDIRSMTNEEIMAFLRQEPHPYDDAKLQENVGHILNTVLARAKPAADGQAQNITYLSGAYGSRKLLEQMAENPQTEEMQELKSRLDTSVQWNFDTLKRLFHEIADINLKPYGEPPFDQYGKWRGLLSGIDQELSAIAREKRIHYIIDNSLTTPANDKAKAHTINTLARDSSEGKNLHVFAMALTPQEAVAEVENQSTGSNKAEAIRSAREFHDSFNVMKEYMPNLTFVDKEGHIILKKRDGEIKDFNAELMAKWNKGFETPAIEKPPEKNPPR